MTSSNRIVFNVIVVLNFDGEFGPKPFGFKLITALFFPDLSNVSFALRFGFDNDIVNGYKCSKQKKIRVEYRIGLRHKLSEQQQQPCDVAGRAANIDA